MNSTLPEDRWFFVGLNLFGLPDQRGRMNSTLREDRWFFVGPNLFGRRGWGVPFIWSNEFDPTVYLRRGDTAGWGNEIPGTLESY